MRQLAAPLALLFLLLSAAPALAETKLATVDFQRALNESEEGKKAKSTLEGSFEATRLKLESAKAEVERLQKEFEANQMMLSAEALEANQNELQTKMLEFQQMVVGNQQEMALLEQEMTGKILQKLYAVAQSVGAEDGYNLIIESSAVVYANGVVDLTDKVVARYNAK